MNANILDMPLIGADILNLITIGMYNNPLAIYREYLQNSADAIRSQKKRNMGHIDIAIDVAGLKLTIRDDGPGLNHNDAIRTLLPVARSKKQRGEDRGFRGIGRLSGLAVAESVTFRTRARKNQSVTKIVWKNLTHENKETQKTSAEAHIAEQVTVTKEGAGDNEPDCFFEVQLDRISRHAASTLLNRELVRRYISEVCPVPFDPKFKSGTQIQELLEDTNALACLTVKIDGEEEPVTRAHNNYVTLSKDRHGDYLEIEEIRIPTVDNKGLAAIGWVAHTDYSGALPSNAGIRGLRAREGNIQIGEENIFDHLFREDRFNRWCVGEIHILDARIVPNGRRDYFEPSPHVRNLENHLKQVAKQISDRCRVASKKRNGEAKVLAALDKLEDMIELAKSGYLTEDGAKALVTQVHEGVSKIEGEIPIEMPLEGLPRTRLKKINNELVKFKPKKEGEKLSDVLQPSEIPVYQKVFEVLVQVMPSAQITKQTIEMVLAET